MSVSPALAGFRAAFRRPSLTFAEIAWRWTFGATAIALALFSLIEYLDTLPVGTVDLALLSTRQPALVVRALTHILRGSLNRTVLAASVATLAVVVLWIFAAAIGRFAILRVLLDTSSSQTDPQGVAKRQHPHPIRALIQLNLLRAAVGLAMLFSIAGAAILSSFVSTAAHPRPGVAMLLFFPLAAIALSAAWSLHWWLTLAAIAAVRNRESALDAISSAVTVSRRYPGSVLAVGIWTGLAHLAAFSIASTAVSFPLAFLQFAPRLVVAVVVLVTLVYFAVVDWVSVARLAGYVYVGEMLEAVPPPMPTTPILDTTIDRNEAILSDLPGGDLSILANPMPGT
jgi:hypothetical protein